jgi:hypothetical protein
MMTMQVSAASDEETLKDEGVDVDDGDDQPDVDAGKNKTQNRRRRSPAKLSQLSHDNDSKFQREIEKAWRPVRGSDTSSHELRPNSRVFRPVHPCAS